MSSIKGERASTKGKRPRPLTLQEALARVAYLEHENNEQKRRLEELRKAGAPMLRVVRECTSFSSPSTDAATPNLEQSLDLAMVPQRAPSAGRRAGPVELTEADVTDVAARYKDMQSMMEYAEMHRMRNRLSDTNLAIESVNGMAIELDASRKEVTGLKRELRKARRQAQLTDMDAIERAWGAREVQFRVLWEGREGRMDTLIQAIATMLSTKLTAKVTTKSTVTVKTRSGGGVDANSNGGPLAVNAGAEWDGTSEGAAPLGVTTSMIDDILSQYAVAKGVLEMPAIESPFVPDEDDVDDVL